MSALTEVIDQVVDDEPRKKLKLADGSPSEAPDRTNLLGKEYTRIKDMMSLTPNPEAQFHITEYVDASAPGFSGIFKKRYTDFLVNEILPSGEVVHLTTLRAAKDKIERSAQTTNQSKLKENLSCGSKSAVDDDPVQANGNDSGLGSRVGVELEEKGSDFAERTTSHPPQVDKPLIGQSADLARPDSLDKRQEATNIDAGADADKDADKDLDTLLTEAIARQVRELYQRCLDNPDTPSAEQGIVVCGSIDRTNRGRVHQLIRQRFQSRLDSQTDNQGHIVITVMTVRQSKRAKTTQAAMETSRNRSNHNHSSRTSWRELGGDHLHFTLYKENKDTMESISWLSRQLRVQPKLFQFAGTKDRRGVTVQRISVFRMTIDRLAGAARTLRNAFVGNFEYQTHQLQLGDLTGNEFVITLRDCRFDDKGSPKHSLAEKVATAKQIVEDSVHLFTQNGFINYFGLQRFGTFGISTDRIGKAMLQGDFKTAIDAILYFNPKCLEAEGDTVNVADAVGKDDRLRAQGIDIFRRTKDVNNALQSLPRRFSAETTIIRHLGKATQACDYQGALGSITRNMRLMYVHAYQSYVWNAAASHRWRQYGRKVVEGDLVLVHEHPPGTADSEISASQRNGNGDIQLDPDGDVIIKPAANDCAIASDDRFVRARCLSREEAESGRYSIFDIVLPTPGFDVLYPANAMADFYVSFMRDDAESTDDSNGTRHAEDTTQSSNRGQPKTLDPFDMRRSWKDISLSGSYRKILARPGPNIKVDVRSYTEDDKQFVQTDMDRINEHKSSKTEQNHEGNHSAHSIQERSCATVDPVSDSFAEPTVGLPIPPSKIAVVLTLQLGSSTYATMALRELMKHGGLQTWKSDFTGGR